MEPLLRIVNLSKTYGTLTALQQITFEVFPGEVVGLAGRSGAGKSVLAMILAGLQPAGEGGLTFANQQLWWPFQAHELGIGVIHQKPSLVDDLDITSNIFLGREIGWQIFGGRITIPNRQRMDFEAARILDQLEVRFPTLYEKVTNLSSEQRQLVAIAQVMARPAKLIFIDEPTVLLSYNKQKVLLSLIHTWQNQGVAIIFSSKNLEHLFAVTDRIITLRHGRQVAEYRTDETSREEVVAALMGTANQQQLTPAIWALDNYYQAREQAERLRQQRTLLERDLAAQDTLNRQLVNQLAEQVKALDQANKALQAAQRRLLTQREQERKRLARELHDQVIQDLLSVNYQLEELETSHNGASSEQAEELQDVRHSIRQLVEEVRRICGNLRPPTIDSLGLGAAIQSYTRDWTERTDIPLTLDLDLKLGRLPEATELSIFRIVQESLNNVRKHSEACAVEISVKHTSPRMLMISIADNGQGLADDFDLSALPAQGHYGLLGISERVAVLGGRLKLQNQHSGGLLLQVEIPHPRVDMNTNSGK
ncbi:MAG TPA: ATP-binding cassette domain-containing protein [Anaerolineae bacterium]